MQQRKGPFWVNLSPKSYSVLLRCQALRLHPDCLLHYSRPQAHPQCNICKFSSLIVDCCNLTWSMQAGIHKALFWPPQYRRTRPGSVLQHSHKKVRQKAQQGNTCCLRLQGTCYLCSFRVGTKRRPCSSHLPLCTECRAPLCNWNENKIW